MNGDDAVGPESADPEPGETGQPESGPLEGELIDGGAIERLLGGDPSEDPDDPLAAFGGGLDMGAMMQMAQDMTERMGTAQAELADARVEGTAGGGLVKVVLNGHLHLLSVEIEPGAIDLEDPSVAGDLVVAAWRDAHDEVARMQAETDPLGGLGGMGGLGGLLGGG